MNTTRWAVALVCALAVFFVTPVWAQRTASCAAHERLVDHLARNFNETVIAAGIDARGNLVEVFGSAEGSWTILVTIPNGPTCILSAGEGWERYEPKPEGNTS